MTRMINAGSAGNAGSKRERVETNENARERISYEAGLVVFSVAGDAGDAGDDVDPGVTHSEVGASDGVGRLPCNSRCQSLRRSPTIFSKRLLSGRSNEPET